MKVGDFAPDFELASDNGEIIKLSSFFGKKKIILFFYIKDNTMGCTAQVNGIKNNYSNLKKEYVVFGINHHSAESHANFCKKNDLPFRLLSDPGKIIATKYGAKGAFGMYTKRITFVIGLDCKISNIIDGMASKKHIQFVSDL